MMGKRTGLSSVVAAVVLAGVAAGCGGNRTDTLTNASPASTAAWADGVCGAISTWQHELTSIRTGIPGQPTRDDIQKALDHARSATQTLVSDLQDLGTPKTDAGKQAHDAVAKLSSDLQSDVTKIQTAVEGATNAAGVLTAVSVASGTLVTMGTQISSTVNELQQLDPKGELGDAFSSSQSCKSLKNGS